MKIMKKKPKNKKKIYIFREKFHDRQYDDNDVFEEREKKANNKII